MTDSPPTKKRKDSGSGKGNGPIENEALPFPMKNLTSFPMEKLPFDLKLKVLDRVEPKYLIELRKVNRKFRSLLLREPWIVFGRHVDEIHFNLDKIWIKKFHGSADICIDINRHSVLINHIHSCDLLSLGQYNNRFNKKRARFVKQLYLFRCDDTDSELMKNIFANLRASINENAYLNVSFESIKKSPSLKELYEFFIEIQLNRCEKVEFLCEFEDSSVDFYFNALAKTQVKLIDCCTQDCFELITQRIINQGIPSKNVMAAIRVHQINAERVKNFFIKHSGVHRVRGDSRYSLIQLAKKRFENKWLINPESPCFRQTIDSGSDCIYVVSSTSYSFYAFYVSHE